MFVTMLMTLLLVQLIILVPLQQHALAQPMTDQNGQQVQTSNQNTVVDNLKNSSGLSVDASMEYDPISLLDFIPFPNPLLHIYGSLTTSSFFSTGTPPDRLVPPFTAQPLPDEDVLIIVLNTTDNTIINKTSLKTDSSGHFRTSIALEDMPRNISQVIRPDILVVTYFEGNEDSFPTHDVRQVTILTHV